MKERLNRFDAVATYSSAIHIGLGVASGAAVDMEYKAGRFPGSSQSEIVATKASPVDVDLTLGFTPYLSGLPEDGCGAGILSPILDWGCIIHLVSSF